MTLRNIILIGVLSVFCSVPLYPAHVGFGVMVGTPPPPPLVVAGPVGPPPGPGFVWVDGYWDWFDGRWVWTPGRWVLPPHAHAVWVAPTFHPWHDHFRFHRGHWR